MDTQTPQPPKTFLKKYALFLIFILFSAAAWIGWIGGRALFPENISPAQKELRAYYKSRGISISGGAVRNESSFVVSQGIFSVKRDGQKYVFFTNDCVTEEDAQKRLVELSPFVTPDRMVRNGAWVLFLSNDWDPQDPLAEEIKKTFLEWRPPLTPKSVL